MILLRGEAPISADSPWKAIPPLFPASVRVALTDSADLPETLFPEEAASLRNAVASRRREFALGRECARAALATLNVPPASIPVGEDRAPVWPRGFIGAITHCRGFVGAAVVSVDTIAGLGFDAEVADPLGEDLRPSICTAEEMAWLVRAPDAPAADWPKILFSAKESIHKCISPLSGGIMLDFTEVTVTFDPARATFSARLVDRDPSGLPDLSRIHGRFGVNQALVFTSAVLKRGDE